jgi:phosphohistidine phosphatase SixA
MKRSGSVLSSLARVLALLLLLGPAWAQQSVPSWDLPAAQLLAEMRSGGRILFWRHPATDFSENDSRMKSFEDCGGQRNLIDKGRDDARKIGIAVRALGIPIGRVLASPFCRTVETAELAFGRTAEKFDEARYQSAADGAERYADLRAALGRSPGEPNMVIIGHGLPFYALTGMRLAEGEIAVVRPLGGRFEVEGRIKPGDWAALRAAAGR